MDDCGICLLDIISDPAALESFLEERNALKSTSPGFTQSVDGSPIEIDFGLRTNGSHISTSPNLIRQNVLPFQVSNTQTLVNFTTQAISSTQAPSPAYHSVASPQVGLSPHNQNALQQSARSPAQPITSPAPSPFSVPTRSPAQPMPPPSPSQNSLPLRSPAQSMPCPSPSTHGYSHTQSPVPMAPSPAQPIYQTKSPAPSLSPYSLQPSKSPALPSPSVQQQVWSPAQPTTSPVPHITSTAPLVQQSLTASVSSSLNVGSAAGSGQMVQIIPAQPTQNSQLRHQLTNMKPIQPKQPQILPKPVGSSQSQFGTSLTKQMAVNQRNTVTVAPGQPNQIVIGQNQVLSNSNMAVSGQGTLLLNPISLGLAQNHPILIQGNAGSLQNLQLVVRPQQPGTITAASSQSAAQSTTPNVNPAALLAALQNQQTLISHAKGQAVVIPGTTNLIAQQQASIANQGIQTRQNVIVNARMMNASQGHQLQFQHIQTPQGPLTFAIAPGQLRGLHNTSLTIANASTGSGTPIGTLLQGVTLPQAHQNHIQGATGTLPSMVLNSQTLAQTQTPSLAPIVSSTTPVSQDFLVPQMQPQAQQQPTKAPSVNLEEVLKQAGIVPSDSTPPSPSLPLTAVTTSLVTTTSMVSIARPHTVMSTVTQTSSQPPVGVSQQNQSVILNQSQIAMSRAPSQLLAQLQQPVTLTQSPQVKLSIAHDGSVILQRPIVSSHLHQTTQSSSFVSSASALGSTANTNTTSSLDGQPIQSVLLQRLSAAPQVQASTSAVAVSNNSIPTSVSSPAENSVFPVAVQSINIGNSPQRAVLAVTTQCGTSIHNVGSSIVSTAPSGLIETHPTLVQSLAQNSANLTPQTSTLAQTFHHKVIQQNSAQQTVVNQVAATTATVVATTQSAAIFTSPATAVPSPSVMKTTTENPTSVVLTGLSGSPIANLQPGQKLQTIQLSPPNQEKLHRIQNQLKQLYALKSPTPQQRQNIQQLQQVQQKIIAQGKVISVQQAPTQIHFMPQHSQIPTSISTTNSVPVPNPTSTSSAQVVVQSAPKPMQNINLTNLLKQVPNQMAVKMNPATSQIKSSAAVSTTTLTTTSQIKLSQVLPIHTLQQRNTFHQLQQLKNMTPEQQQQLKNMTPEQQQQQQLFLAQNKAVILKLQQQQQQQSQQQQQQQQQSSQSSAATVTVQQSSLAPVSTTCTPAIAVATNTPLTGGILVIQTIGKGIAQVKSVVPSVVQEQTNRGIKRPAPSPVTQTIHSIQQQLVKDQNDAVNPDCKNGFYSVTDACKRLLKYHVFHSEIPTKKDLNLADNLFETVSEQLLEKAHLMLNKYQYLLLKESLREWPTSEMVMLNRMFIQDEMSSLEEDKQAVKDGKDLDLPPPPDHWLSLLESLPSLCTTDSLTTLTVATTTASANSTTSTTTVHSVPLASPISSSDEDVKSPKYFMSHTSNKFNVNRIRVKEEIDETKIAVENVIKDLEVDSPNKSLFLPKVKVEVKVEDDNKYDEWAEIQKELEIFPLENENSDSLELSSAHVDFDPPEESTAALADFEPPVEKPPEDSSSLLDQLTREVQEQLQNSCTNSGAANAADTGELEGMDTSSDWEDYAAPVDNNRIVTESEAAVESILQPSEPELDLAVIDDFSEHYSENNGASCNDGGIQSQHRDGSSDIILDGSNEECDIVIDQPHRSQDDDLNAQVQSAINSILNLQRTDNPFEHILAEYPLSDLGEAKCEDQITMEYEATLNMDTKEVDVDLEEAVKSILM